MLMVAEKVQLGGTAGNDLFIATGTLVVEGHCAADVWAFGRDSIRIDGSIADDARLVGAVVNIDGRVAGDLSALASTVRTGTGSVVGASATIAAEDAILLGDVAGDLHVTAARVTLGGRIGGNVVVEALDLVLQPGLNIAGNLVCALPSPIRPDSRVHIGGTTQYREPPDARPWPMVIALYAAIYAGGVLSGLPLVLIFHRFASRAALRLRRSWPRAMLAGLAAALFIPAAVAISLSWAPTLPLGLVLAAGGGLASAIAPGICAVAIGGAILRRPHTESPSAGFAALAVGMLPLVLAAALPGAALTVLLSILFLGTGVLALLILPARRPPPVPPTPPEA
jgi:cytoskeletal protein CcmA (bactofilin family)